MLSCFFDHTRINPSAASSQVGRLRPLSLCLLVACLMCLPSVSVFAETVENVAAVGADATDELGDEYRKLLDLVAEKKRPVKEVDALLDISGQPAIGAEGAQLVLIEFGDFQCPYCRRHLEQGAMPEIKSNHVDKGQLRYVFFDFPVAERHAHAAKAAEAARCAAEQGRYWQMRKHLYSHQKALHPMFLEGHAEQVGLDLQGFQACLEDERYAQAVAEDHQIGKTLGIRGTPSFFLGTLSDDRRHVRVVRRISGAQPYTAFHKQIQHLLVASQ